METILEVGKTDEGFSCNPSREDNVLTEQNIFSVKKKKKKNYVYLLMMNEVNVLPYYLAASYKIQAVFL